MRIFNWPKKDPFMVSVLKEMEILQKYLPKIVVTTYCELDEFIKYAIKNVKVDENGGYWLFYTGGGTPCFIEKLWNLHREGKI